MREYHPYGVFIPKKPKAMIIGSFPIGKFSNPSRRHEIKSHEQDFFFGGEKNLLWKLLGEVFQMKVSQKKDIIRMLEKHGLAIGDVIESCVRKDHGGSDSDLLNIQWNHKLIHVIRENNIRKVFFTSKKVEAWFQKLFPETNDLIKVTLISPSAQSVRSITRREDYIKWFKSHPDVPKFDFILSDYRNKFETGA